MANLPIKTTATAFIFHNDRLLLIWHKKTGKLLPTGGHSEENETIEETLIREVKEETNLDVKFIEEFGYYKGKEHIQHNAGYMEVPKPFFIHKRNSSTGEFRRVNYDFLCVAEDINDLRIQESELDGYEWLSEYDVKNSDKLWEPIRILALKAFEIYKKFKEDIEENKE